MIEINLLPGAKKKRGGGAKFQMPDFKQLATVVKDPWLAAVEAQAETGNAPAPGDSTGGSTLNVQITGKSGDIQAVTRFVRNLEESPFLENATQVSTAVVTEGGRDVYTYVIRARYQMPD